MASTSSGASNVLNRVFSHGKGAKIWFEGNMFTIRKKPNLSRGVKFAYWDCAHPGCKVTCKTVGIDSLDGFEYGRTKVHNHGDITCGEIIRMEMVEKGKLRALTQTESIGKILEDLEKEYVTTENYKSVQWNRENMRQVLHRERAKNWPKIPQTLEEYDSAKGKNSLKTGGKVIWYITCLIT